MTKATKAITDILTACGCKPAATTDENGDILIKVNAPTIREEDGEKTENGKQEDARRE